MEERRDTEQMEDGEEAEEMKGETWGDVETHTERNKMRKKSHEVTDMGKIQRNGKTRYGEMET